MQLLSLPQLHELSHTDGAEIDELWMCIVCDCKEHYVAMVRLVVAMHHRRPRVLTVSKPLRCPLNHYSLEDFNLNSQLLSLNIIY